MWAWENKSKSHRIRWVFDKRLAHVGVIPDYYTSLEAMHEAEKKLSSYQCAMYRDILNANPICFDDMIGGCIDWQLVHATAEQRAEAFCRTLEIGPFSNHE